MKNNYSQINLHKRVYEEASSLFYSEISRVSSLVMKELATQRNTIADDVKDMWGREGQSDEVNAIILEISNAIKGE